MRILAAGASEGSLGGFRVVQRDWAADKAANPTQIWNFAQTFIFSKLSKSLNFPFSSNFTECQRLLSFPEHFR